MWLPATPNMSPSDLWHGYGTDAGVIAFNPGAAALGTRIITTGDAVYKFTVSGWSDFLPQYGLCNGYMFWYSASGYWLYYANSNWIIHNKFPGYIPVTASDAWYQRSSLPFGDGVTGDFAATGTISGGAAKTATFSFSRWTSSTFLGVYAAAGGASGTKSLGCPRWKDASNVYYTRSSLKGDNGYYTYGAIYHHSSGWIIGTYGDAGGWYTGSEPSLTAPVTFTQTVTAATLTITFNDYIQGTDTIDERIGEIAIWR